MKLKDFFAVIDCSALLSISETIEPMDRIKFYHTYKNSPEWNAEVFETKLIPHGTDVICLIMLKQ